MKLATRLFVLFTTLSLQGCGLLPFQNINGVMIRAPESLRVELLRGAEVSNIRDPQPEFSWALPSQARASKQTAYQIQLAKANVPFDQRSLATDSESRLTWDSGKVERTRSLAQSYTGEPLQPGDHYHWRVRVWTESANGESGMSVWSAPQRFTMAKQLDEFASYHKLTYSLIKPVHTKRLPSGRLLLDFGKVAFGYLELELSSDRAGTIDVHFGERGQSEGEQAGILSQLHRGSSVRYYKVPLQLNAKADIYAIHPPKDKRNTKSKAIAIPGRFGRIAPFRFIELDPKGLSLSQIKATLVAVHYPFDQYQSSFHSSDETLNAIWELCKYSMKATSFAGLYVDGDRERIPYEADVYINQLSHYYVDSEFSLARASHDYLMRHPTWPTEWKQHSVMIAWTDWQYTGDLDSLRVHYEQIKKEKTLEQYASSTGLLRTYPKRNSKQSMGDLVDWPPSERDNYDFREVNTVVNSFYYLNLNQMAQMAGALGYANDETYYQGKAKQVYQVFNQQLFDAKTGLYLDGPGSSHSSAHANIAPLAFGLVPEQHKAKVIEFIKSRGMAVSVYFAQYLMEALYLNGEAEYALSLLTSKGKRSWYNMLREGSTITMEAWDDAFKRNQDWNHAWGAVPGNIVGRYILGVEPQVAGLSTVSIKPKPASIQFAQGYVPTIRGQIFVGIRQELGKQFELELTIPGNTQALVTLPVKAGQKVKQVMLNKERVAYQITSEGVALPMLGAGYHQIQMALEP